MLFSPARALRLRIDPADARPVAVQALINDYRRVIRLATVVFLALVGATLWAGWQRQQATEVRLAQRRVHATAIRLQSVIKSATDHVAQSVAWAQAFPLHTPYAGAADVRQALAQAMNAPDGVITLDALQAVPQPQRLAQILALPGARQPVGPGLPSELDLAVALADRIGWASQTSAFLRWTYFNAASRNLLLLAPWASQSDILAAESGVDRFLQHAWTYEMASAGLPANNPQRRPYWTRAYQDQAGAGQVVSHGAPIYWGERFVGILATDVQLDVLTDQLAEFPDPQGTLVLTNVQGQVLAQRRAAAAAGGSGATSPIHHIHDLLPKAQLGGLSLHPLQGERVGGSRVFSESLGDPHWHVVFVLPQALIHQRVVQDFAPQLVLSLVLVLGAWGVNLAVWRMDVAPALAIASYVAQESTVGRSPLPRVPPSWQPWLDAMAQAFADRRRYLDELQKSHDDLEQRVTERTQALRETNARLEALAVTDPLTGAFNRRHLFDLMQAERERVLRGGGTFALLMMDLDFFKAVNDCHGHAAGDAVLCECVRRCHAVVRKTDVVCRFGGEEFVVFMPALHTAGASQLAERLRAAIASRPMAFEDQLISVTVSMGVTSYRRGESLEELISRADHRLYRAKEAGRNQVVAQEA